MQSDKEKSAHEAYKKYLDIMLYDVPLEQLDELVESDLTGYGTTLDEKILEIERLRKLVIDQREQGAGYDINFVIHPVHRRMSSNENSAIFVDEIEITMSINGEKNVIPLRFSTVLEFIGGGWKVVHLHGSVAVNTEGDTWHKDEHRKKIEELQKLVSEKTADLITKNKELEIEASLERIRAIAMSMQKAEGLLDVVEILNTELKTLGFTDIRNTIINIFNDTKQKFLNYDYSDYGVGGISEVDYNSHPSNKKFVNKMREASKDFMITEFTGHELDEWRKWRIDQGQMPYSKLDQAESLYYYEFSIGVGSIGISTFSPINADQLKILSKIRNVFSLAYQRYSDIALAEAQAREAQIEASLERVRAVAMSMNKSDDLLSICEVSFNEFKKLGFNNLRNSLINIFNDEEESFVNYDYSDYLGGSISNDAYNSNRANEEFLIQIRKANDAFVETVIDRNQLDEWKEFRRSHGEKDDPRLDNINALYYYNYSIGSGSIGISNFIPISKEQQVILKRFRNVFNLAYRRYNDIALAEAQAREAVKQASLDRVRAEIASMRTSEDLNRITPIIWRELKNFEVPFFRSGVFIVDEDKAEVQVYLTTPDGKSLGVLNLPFDSNELTSNTVEFWRKKEVYKEHWNQEEFITWTKSMMKLEQVQNAETYQGSATPPESLYLHFVPFGQGMLYVGDVQPLTDEKLQLVKTLAEAFSTAYARYEDFKNLEEAKNKIEITLNELKTAQAQLVHSEKMASLGELTAGIAHEIKNPLNFVNNFSEVSRELLDEMKTEIDNKNIGEVIELIEDLKQNLDKINQHGKRADSIVKGMLLHSRGTSGEKTLTDINDLLDQYVNLAYHGMRAQNKEFNIAIEKDYDESIEKINVVPQDISRVFLNIINNACYAAYERKKLSRDDNFSPTLRFSTKNLKDKVEIRISDNGNGIPPDHLDKIFQPFFTTKPTGEGTGLGLSLSYDIVTKMHDGELKVETKEGESTEFIIKLKA